MGAVMTSDLDDTSHLVVNDALNRECVPLDEDPDEDPMRFLAHDGIDHTTGLDSLFSPTHDGVLICAGFAMMENEDDC